jgi:hypothetical protein
MRVRSSAEPMLEVLALNARTPNVRIVRSIAVVVVE